jgi:hypothetical protein
MAEAEMKITLENALGAEEKHQDQAANVLQKQLGWVRLTALNCLQNAHLQLVQQVIHAWDRIPVLYGDLVEGATNHLEH